jgi:hypothetical protein
MKTLGFRPDRMIKYGTALGIALLVLVCPAHSEDAEWIDLFDGHSLVGWKPNFDDQSIVVKDGVIEMLSVKKNLWLVHEREFTDFELEGEIKAPLTNYNTGIAFRCDERPLGYQGEIFDRQSGSLYAIKQGWIFPESKAKLEQFYAIAGDCYKPGVWNHYRIRCVGEHIQIWVNGHLTTDIRDGTYTRGRVAIQHHGKGAVHYFRNLRLRSI